MLRGELSPENFTRVAEFLPGAPETQFVSWEYWSNAVFFAATIMTTVGYGNFTPQTPGGRLFTAFYAMFSVGLVGYWCVPEGGGGGG